jgi:NAD(P)-dependent dehydrogenase (short-subunit alcohol dehydrogenase family)
MKMIDNTILITGGGSGIGRGLAEAFHKLGNQVIIVGRGRKTLDETIAANPGMKSVPLDVSDPKSIQSFAEKVTKDYSSLNVLINMAGMMKPENLLEEPFDLSTAEKTITTNLLGPIRLTAALLPSLRKQPRATIMNVSSGLAFVPLAMTPNLLRDQSRDPFLHPIPALPAQGDKRGSDGTHTALRADHAHGRSAGGGFQGDAVERIHRRGHVDLEEPVRCERDLRQKSLSVALRSRRRPTKVRRVFQPV